MKKKMSRTMHEMKQGELKSGRSGKKVKNPKQAIAIGLSEARRAGADVPPPPGRKGAKKATKKKAVKKGTAKKTTAKKTAAKKKGTKKKATKKS